VFSKYVDETLFNNWNFLRPEDLFTSFTSGKNNTLLFYVNRSYKLGVEKPKQTQIIVDLEKLEFKGENTGKHILGFPINF
jgi:hypothetical protein